MSRDAEKQAALQMLGDEGAEALRSMVSGAQNAGPQQVSATEAAAVDAALRQMRETVGALQAWRARFDTLPVPAIRRPKRSARRYALALAAAAAAVVVLAATTLLLRRSDTPAGGSSEVLSGNVVVDGARMGTVSEGSPISVAGKTPAVIRLTDGSQAELEPATSAVLHGRTKGLRQLVELVQGGGTFHVEKANGDFRVVTPLGSVTALGTEFSVRILPPRDQGESGMKMHGALLAVAVLAGTVQVDFGGKAFVLNGGEDRVFAEDQGPPAARATKSVPTGKTLDIKLASGIASAAEAKKNIEGCKAALEKLKADGKITRYELADYGAGPVLNLSDSGIGDLSVLKDMPITELNLYNCKRVTDLAPLRNLPLRSLNLMCSPLSDFSALKEIPTLKSLVLAQTKVDMKTVAGLKLEVLSLNRTGVNDIAPLKGMPLKGLDLACDAVSDLSPLIGMPLEALTLGDHGVCCPVKDLRPLRNLPLKRLNIEGAPVADLAALKGLKLEELNLGGVQVTDLSPLQGMPIRDLYLGFTPVSDLTPLKGMPLWRLTLINCEKLTDISPLKGSPVSDLNMGGYHDKSCAVSDISPLAECKNLVSIITPVPCKNFEPLRNLPKLQKINNQPAAEFWKQHDAGAPKAGTMPAKPDQYGFLFRWLVLLEPIQLPELSPLKFRENSADKEFFPGMKACTPKEGDTVKLDNNDLEAFWKTNPNSKKPGLDVARTWQASHADDFRVSFAPQHNSLYLAVTYVICAEEIPDVKLKIGAGDYSVWLLNGKEIIRALREAKALKIDEEVSQAVTLKKGVNVLMAELINCYGGETSLCARFVDKNDNPVRNIAISLTPPAR